MHTVFFRDSNLHLLLDHKINQKTMLTPSSPETWRMIIRQQQQERKIVSQRTNLRATKQQALTISYNPQRNSTRPHLRPSHNNISECPFKGCMALNLSNSFKPFQKNEACRRLVIVLHTANKIMLFFNYIFLGIYPRFFNFSIFQHAISLYLYISCT